MRRLKVPGYPGRGAAPREVFEATAEIAGAKVAARGHLDFAEISGEADVELETAQFVRIIRPLGAPFKDFGPLRVRAHVAATRSQAKVVRRLMAARDMSGARKLVVVMPGDRIEPGLAERAGAALVRSCSLKLEDNDAELQLMRREAGRLLLRGIFILLACMGAASVFNSEVIGFLPPLVNSTLGEGFNVIGWVMLWRPVEAYFFGPLAIRASSAAHRFLKSLQIEIRPAPDSPTA